MFPPVGDVAWVYFAILVDFFTAYIGVPGSLLALLEAYVLLHLCRFGDPSGPRRRILVA